MKGLVIALDPSHDILIHGLTQAGYQVENHHQASIEDLNTRWSEAVGLIVRGRLPINHVHLQQATSLQWIGRLGSGLEHIDVVAANKMGIACYAAPEGNRIALGEHLVGMLLAHTHKVALAHEQVKQGLWDRESNSGWEIHGSTVGILGYGHMGSAFAERLQGFGCQLIAHDKYRQGHCPSYVEEVSLLELQQRSDILSIHLPLNEETHAMVDGDFLRQCERHPLIINSSRGAVVRSQDAWELLRDNQLRGLVLDVVDLEKASLLGLRNQPDWFKAMCNDPRTLITPHVAGWSEQSFPRMASILLEKILTSPVTE